MKFDHRNPIHLNFVLNAAILRAQNYCIPISGTEKSIDFIVDIISKALLPQFLPPKRLVDKQDEERIEMARIAELYKLIPKPSEIMDLSIAPCQFVEV